MRYIGPKSCAESVFSKKITPVFSENNNILVKNDRPVSVLPTVSKIFERIMQKQIMDYINHYLLTC